MQGHAVTLMGRGNEVPGVLPECQEEAELEQLNKNWCVQRKPECLDKTGMPGGNRGQPGQNRDAWR